MKERRVWFGRLGPLPRLSQTDIDRISANLEAAEQQKIRQTETVTLVVGEHQGGCGGEVEYTSSFRDVAPMSQIVGAGHTPVLREFVTCCCKRCGSAITYPEHLAKYAKLIEAHRNRKD